MHVGQAVELREVRHRDRHLHHALGIDAVLGAQNLQHVQLLVRVQGLEDAKRPVFHLGELLFLRLAHDATHGEHAERGVARLVLFHTAEHLRQQRIARLGAHEIHDPDRHALKQRLHAEGLLVRGLGFEQTIEQDLQRGIDRVDHSHLALQELGDHLDVPRLVRDLARGVPFLVHLRARVGQLATQLKRGLLAMQELRERVGELIEGRGLLRRLVLPHELADLRHHRRFGTHHPRVVGDGDRPVEVRLGVPLIDFPLVVELAQLGDLAPVVPLPVQGERDCDVDLLAQTLDLGLVHELDHLELAEPLAMLLHQLFHTEPPRGRGARP